MINKPHLKNHSEFFICRHLLIKAHILAVILHNLFTKFASKSFIYTIKNKARTKNLIFV